MPLTRDDLPFLREVRDVLFAEGLKEGRDPERANQLNRLWREAGELIEQVEREG